jgi:hypothetical protein
MKVQRFLHTTKMLHICAYLVTLLEYVWTHMELNLPGDPTIVLPPPRGSCETRQCESWKMKTTQIPYVQQTISACISNVWSFANQYIPELMFAHYANSILCGQTFISPIIITSLICKKKPAKISGAVVQILLQSHSWNKLNFATRCMIRKRTFYFLMIFRCTRKPQWQ